ncbi:MAG: SOS response-associated peptidase [Pseudomonadota bacterium]
MCGRFAVGDTDGTDWADWLAIEPDLGWPPPGRPAANWNVAPTQRVEMVRLVDGVRRADAARWGLIPFWWRKPLSEFRMTTFNARSEEASGKPTFRDAWKRGHCVIPAIGYYEWTGKKGAKTPYFITNTRNTPGLWFAGLWTAPMVDGERMLTCTILTTAAGQATVHLHPRSPVVLEDADAADWLAYAGDPASMMRPIPDDRVTLHEVDRAVGKVSNNGPNLIERVGLDL